MHTMSWLLVALLDGGVHADEAELPSTPPCGGACTSEQQCVSERCDVLFEEDAFLEGRFNIVQPREVGAAANAVLDTIERLGIDHILGPIASAPIARHAVPVVAVHSVNYGCTTARSAREGR